MGHHGAILMKYQTMRGGRLVLQDTTTEWGTPLQALVTVLDLGKKMAQSLLELQTKATAKSDFHLVNFVQENFLNYHTFYIKMIGDLVSKTKRVGDGLGIHIVDRDIARMAAHIMDKYFVRAVRHEHETTAFIPREDVTNFVVKEALPDYVVA